METLVIRDAKREDCKDIRRLIQELADFEKMPDGPKLDSAALEKDGFETEPPLFYSTVATINNEIVGYTIYYYTYSTWMGKSMFLDDLYVTPTFRNKTIGDRLFKAVVQKAVESDCRRLDFVVLSWNPAEKFYKSRGVVDITETEDWHCYRLQGQTLIDFAKAP